MRIGETKRLKAKLHDLEQSNATLLRACEKALDFVESHLGDNTFTRKVLERYRYSTEGGGELEC